MRQHREATASFAGVGGLDRGVDGEQVGLCGNVGHVGGHLLQLVDEAAEVLHLLQHLAIAGHGGAQRVEHRMQLLVTVGEHGHQALAVVLCRAGGQIGGLHGLVELVDDATEALRQRRDGLFHLHA